jgi:hypothetical protein
MLPSKSDQVVFAFVLSVLGATFVVFLLWNLSFWAVESFPIVAAVLFIPSVLILFLVLPRGTIAERAIMFCALLVFAYAFSSVLDDRRVLLPVWVLPALAIIFLLLGWVLVFGVHREGGKIKFRSPLYKLKLFSGLTFLGLSTALFWQQSTKDGSYPLSFDSRSDQLKQTVVVPTLDTPFPAGKSALWCASFQIAWNRLKSDLAKGPVQIQGAELVVGRLNHAEQTEEDLEPGSFYSAAGWVKDGIMEKIQAEMAGKFPNARKVDFHKSDLDFAVAFGYLQAEVMFTTPFEEREGPIFFFNQEEQTEIRRRFHRSAEQGTVVKFFGISVKPGHKEIREQVEVLYFAEAGDEYAVDLCKSSFPNQVVLASLPKKATLGQTLADLDKKSSEFLSKKGSPRLEDGESLAVPNMHWRIEHHFKELEGNDKPLLNSILQGTWIGDAVQVIEFKLDRRSASLTGVGFAKFALGPRTFMFNGPFLLYMKKRGAKHPFFVMWVDNAELLIKK